MRAIYEPRGAALEYAPFAVNLYRGCGHGCLYCYAPACLRMSREAFANPAPRKGVLKQLELDAARLAAEGATGPVLLCFTCDPYQPIEKVHGMTRSALTILGQAGLGIRVLTKNPRLALDRDLVLLKKYGVEFGSTCLFTLEEYRERWEPGASSIIERVRALSQAHELGLTTWMSIEPVIDIDQALALLDMRFVDLFTIGKLNHDRAREAAIPWRTFLAKVLAALEGRRCGYYIKDALWEFADEEIREFYTKEWEARK